MSQALDGAMADLTSVMKTMKRDFPLQFEGEGSLARCTMHHCNDIGSC